MMGVLMRAAAVMMISRNLGMPSVTLASPRPALWKVFSVICVDGSPEGAASQHNVYTYAEEVAEKATSTTSRKRQPLRAHSHKQDRQPLRAHSAKSS